MEQGSCLSFYAPLFRSGKVNLAVPISELLREKKLQALTGDTPTLIATANVGCQLHLGEAAGIPVVHWIELLDDC